MILKRIDELKGNEKLARALTTQDYQIILPEGAILKKEYFDKLFDLGILNVYVEEEESETNEMVILKSEIKNVAKEKVKDILERHTYRHNQNLVELSQTADHIISNILEEEQLVEQIFDIKERSTDIYEHSINICSLAILTALKLDVPKDKIHDIGVACLLHDIGFRYSTVDFTNRNVHSMNEQELIEYRKHSIYAYSALKNEKWISELSKNIILCHHERLDGSGFPLHLKEISPECQIVSVCDVFDEKICGIARTKVKVYEAIEYMKNYKNIKFDSKVVDAFLSFTAVYPAGSYVLTNQGETAVVLSQNKDFQDRPVIKIIKDRDGKKPADEQIIDLVKVQTVFIDKVLD